MSGENLKGTKAIKYRAATSVNGREIYSTDESVCVCVRVACVCARVARAGDELTEKWWKRDCVASEAPPIWHRFAFIKYYSWVFFEYLKWLKNLWITICSGFSPVSNKQLLDFPWWIFNRERCQDSDFIQQEVKRWKTQCYFVLNASFSPQIKASLVMCCPNMILGFAELELFRGKSGITIYLNIPQSNPHFLLLLWCSPVFLQKS